jgi:hypothetical protein
MYVLYAYLFSKWGSYNSGNRLSSVHIWRLCRLSSSEREFMALMSCAQYALMECLITSRALTPMSPEDANEKIWKRMKGFIGNDLMANYNLSQRKVIEEAATRPGFTLVQGILYIYIIFERVWLSVRIYICGVNMNHLDSVHICLGPPGSGKTSTLLGILNTLHLSKFSDYQDRLIALVCGEGNQAAPSISTLIYYFLLVWFLVILYLYLLFIYILYLP